MDASRKIQRGIHVHLIQFLMCPESWVHITETVEKLRFSDNLCLDFAKHGREKVPMQKLFLSQSIKAEVHAPSFYAFALQMLFDARCRAYW